MCVCVYVCMCVCADMHVWGFGLIAMPKPTQIPNVDSHDDVDDSGVCVCLREVGEGEQLL